MPTCSHIFMLGCLCVLICLDIHMSICSHVWIFICFHVHVLGCSHAHILVCSQYHMFGCSYAYTFTCSMLGYSHVHSPYAHMFGYPHASMFTFLVVQMLICSDAYMLTYLDVHILGHSHASNFECSHTSLQT